MGSPIAKERDQKTTTEGDSLDESFSVADLFLDGRRDATSLLRDLAEEASAENRSWKTLSLIARLLAGRSLAGAGGSERLERGETKAEQEDDEAVSESESRRQALDEFNHQLYQELGKAREKNRNLVPVLVVWLNVNLDMSLRYSEEPSRAFIFVDQWIRLAINSGIDADVRKGLDESVFGVAAALGLKIRNRRMEEDGIFRQEFSAELVHQWLERYFGDDVDAEIACERANAWFLTETPNRLIDGQVENAVRALSEVLATTTRRTHLARIVEAQGRGERLEFPEGVFGAKDIVLLDELRRAKPDRPRHRLVRNQQKGCPKCYSRLLTDIRATLRTRRVDRCIQCTTILVLLDP